MKRKLLSLILVVSLVCGFVVPVTAEFAPIKQVRPNGVFVDIGDALEILKHLAGIRQLSSEERLLYDFRGDDVINIDNVMIVLKSLAGLTEPVRIMGTQSEWANLEIENMTDVELRTMWRNGVPEIELRTFDDFGVPLLEEGDMWDGGRVQWGEGFHPMVQSAGSFEEANQRAHEFSPSFLYDTVEFIGENELYYSFRLAGAYDDIWTNERVASVRRLIFYKSEAYLRVVELGVSISEVGVRDYDTVLYLLDTFNGGWDGHGIIYRSLYETDSQFIYITYSVRGYLGTIELVRNERIIDKETGQYVNAFGGCITIKSIRVSDPITVPTKPKTPLTKEMEQKIKTDWLGSSSTSWDKFDFSFDYYYGTYNESVVMFLWGGGWFTIVSGEEVGNYYFHYAHLYHINVWNNGKFYRLGEAFELGLLTNKDLNDIAYYHGLYYGGRHEGKNY
jgi:hypothetical protein